MKKIYLDDWQGTVDEGGETIDHGPPHKREQTW